MIVTQCSPVVGQAVKVSGFRFRGGSFCLFQVLGPGVVRWGTNKDQLEQNPAGGWPQSNADGIVEHWWYGELWAVSDTANTPIEFIDSQHDFQSQFGLGGFRQ